jgi:hypothetical protein
MHRGLTKTSLLSLIVRRPFTTSSAPLISIKAKSPLVVRAAWSDEVNFPSDAFTLRKGPDIADHASYVLEESSSSAGTTPMKVSVPRRCREFRIDTIGSFTLEGDDKLEVEKDIQIQAIGDIAINCTTRGNIVNVGSDGTLRFKSAVEGLLVQLRSGKDLSARRLGAKQAKILCGQSVSITSLYVEEANIAVVKGNGHLGTVHGQVEVNVQSGDLTIESISGLLTAQVVGNATVHLEQSYPRARHSLSAGKQAKVYLSVDSLPITITSAVKVEVTDSDVRFKDGRLELLRPTESEGAGAITIKGDASSSVSLRSWIESALAKAQKKIDEREAQNP